MIIDEKRKRFFAVIKWFDCEISKEKKQSLLSIYSETFLFCYLILAKKLLINIYYYQAFESLNHKDRIVEIKSSNNKSTDNNKKKTEQYHQGPRTFVHKRGIMTMARITLN